MWVWNRPNPAGFAESLKHWSQRGRSWYVLFFQLPRVPEWSLGRNGARGIREAFRGMAVDKARFPDPVLEVYARAAQRPGALTAMVNWYRAAVRHRASALAIDDGRVETPTPSAWGEGDSARGLETRDLSLYHI